MADLGVPSRGYRGADDRRAIQELASRTWFPAARWHPGDIGWQHDAFPDEPTEQIRLWARPGGPLLAWGLVDEPGELDLSVDPGCPGLASQVLRWFAATGAGPGAAVTVTDQEQHLIAALAERGYQADPAGPFFTRQVRALAGLPEVALPGGYLAHPVGPDDLARRAQSHRGAWQSARMSDDRYRAI